MSRKLSSRLALAGKLTITGLALWLLFTHRGNDGNLLALLSRISSFGMTIAVILLLGQAALNSLRWQLIAGLIASRPSFSQAFQSVMTGLFFSQVLPSTIGGDAVRWWYAYRAGMPPLRAMSSVVLDRIIGLLILMFLTLTMAPVAGEVTKKLLPPWIVGAVLALAALGVGCLLWLSRLPERARSWKVMRIPMALAEDACVVLLNPRMAPLLFAISVFSQVLSISSVCVLSGSMGLGIAPEIFFVVVPPALLLAALPVSLGGWGVREGAFVLGLGLFSVPNAEALALALMFGLASLVVGLIGGMVWWFTKESRETSDFNALEMRDTLSAAVSKGQK